MGARVHRLLEGPATLVASAALVAGCNVAFHGVAVRSLDGPAYAAVAALLGLVMIACVPVVAVQTAVTRAVAADPGASAAALLARTSRAALLVLVIAVAASPAVAAVVGVDDVLATAQVGAWLGVALLGASARGVALGRQRFKHVSMSLIVGTGCRALACAALAPSLGGLGALLATVVGESVSTALAIAAAADHGGHRQVRARGDDAGFALGAQLGLWLFAALGALLGNQLLAAGEQADFAVIAAAGGAALVLPLSVGTATFPRFAAGGGRVVLLRAAAGAAVVGAVVTVGLAVAGRPALERLAGRTIQVEPVLLVVLGVAALVNGIGGVAASLLVARRSVGALLPWVGVTVSLVVAMAGPATPLGIATALLIGSSTFGVCACVAAHRVAGRPVAQPAMLPDVPAADGGLDLSVVIPSKDGGDELRPAVLDVLRAIESRAAEVIVVLDGSTDGSGDTIADLPVRVLALDENQGKGAALRHGFAHARGRVIAFIDGDRDLDASVLGSLVDCLASDPGAWAAVADREHPASLVTQSRSRAVVSRAHRVIVDSILRPPVRDTQCGAKAFRRAALAAALPHCSERRFAFDLELLLVGDRLGLGRAVGVPVRLLRGRGARSTVGSRAILRSLSDIVRVRQTVLRLEVHGPAEASTRTREGDLAALAA